MNYKAIAAAILEFAMALSCGDFKAKKWGNEAKDDEIKTRAISTMSALIEIKLRLKKLPAVNPAKWIPCSERMPETNDMVLVSCKLESGYKHVTRAYYDKEENHWTTSGVIAWMPQPEPYDGEVDE